MSQQHSSTNQADQTHENPEGIEEGYETPTSEEHRIPPVCLRCPPPAPKIRKRTYTYRRISIGKVVLSGKIVPEKEINAFFSDMIQSRPPPPPVSEPEPISEPEPDHREDTF
ncbi:hypothetical protein AAHA92_08685 [Salvia divinorum]|uniref:Uncharacterized protein n=1 Tax=Salvia divinorum TaxID=28513 RepID=A0ABD1HP27_SALDI